MLIEQNKELQIKINELNKSIKERDSKLESINNTIDNDEIIDKEQDDNLESISSNTIDNYEITELYNKIESMESLIDQMTRESNDDKEKINQLISLLEENQLNDEPYQAIETTEQKEIFKNNDEFFTPTDFGKEINYASTQIGKVIVKISDFCNNMVSTNDQNARELINLALGRGEVFKADVMNVLQSNASFNDKESIIEDKIKDVDSYITSLYGQL